MANMMIGATGKFEGITLTRENLRVEDVHDGRHALADRPLMRESIPYCVVLPEEKIGFITYFWVDKESLAGAALGLWGPDIGKKPIQVRLRDRPVPNDMNFDAWQIDGFSMQQDLKFGTAHIRWESAEAELDFSFEAFHPPYAYSSHKHGSPSYASDDRIEQSGRVIGTLKIGGRTIAMDTTGHRDHSWGTRDWGALHFHRWLHAQVGDEVSVHFWEFYALGQRQVRGYVFKDKVMAELTELDFHWQGDDLLNQTSFQCTVRDDAGRETRLEADVFGVCPLIPDPNYVLNEGAAVVKVDGRSGAGWVEMGWPASYLRHVAENGPYRRDLQEAMTA